VPIVATAAALILLGLLPSLHVTRRRVWLRVTPAQGAEAPGGRTRVELAGHALQGKLAFVDEFDQLVGSVRDALPAESRPKGYAVPGR
jgi:cytochrome c biogenesis protein